MTYLKSLKDPLVMCGDVALSLNRLNSLKDPPSPDPLSPDTTLSGGLYKYIKMLIKNPKNISEK